MKQRHIRLLAATSRTFLIPIMRAPQPLRDAVGTAYLCMRSIDEVEDHARLPRAAKALILRAMAEAVRGPADQTSIPPEPVDFALAPWRERLPEVARSFLEIAEAVPVEVRGFVWPSTADMAEEMADWAERNWAVHTERDLDEYTYTVAGRVGVLLTRLWEWYDGTRCDEADAIAFGRALQAVNIVRNNGEDNERGVSFMPDGWNPPRMMAYARRQLEGADRYMQCLPAGPVYDFCAIPLALAKATLNAREAGREKLSSQEVHAIVNALNGRNAP